MLIPRRAPACSNIGSTIDSTARRALSSPDEGHQQWSNACPSSTHGLGSSLSRPLTGLTGPGADFSEFAPPERPERPGGCPDGLERVDAAWPDGGFEKWRHHQRRKQSKTTATSPETAANVTQRTGLARPAQPRIPSCSACLQVCAVGAKLDRGRDFVRSSCRLSLARRLLAHQASQVGFLLDLVLLSLARCSSDPCLKTRL